jgi:hypothetical protein
MTEPWFDPDRWAWLSGTVLGCLIGLWGSLAGAFVPLRKGRPVVYGVGLLSAGMATASVIAGLTALGAGQPFDVWFFLVVPALPIGIIILIALCYLPRFYHGANEDHAQSGQLSCTEETNS